MKDCAHESHCSESIVLLRKLSDDYQRFYNGDVDKYYRIFVDMLVCYLKYSR